MISRRDFIKAFSMFGIIVLTPIDKWLRKLPFNLSNSEDTSEGELYEGFVLLDLIDSSVPLFVENAPCPILCQEVEDEDFNSDVSEEYRGEMIWFKDIDELRENIYFPLFIPSLLPEGMMFLQGYILRFTKSKEIWETRIDFGFKDNAEPLISISARTMFSKPFPVWPVITYPEKSSDEIILDNEYILNLPEKVEFTPELGIKIPTDNGYTLQWIQEEILYTIFMEYSELKNDAEGISKSLIEK